MLNSVFSIMGCPFCKEMHKAVLLVNPSLPIDKKIWITDIHFGESTVNYLEVRNPDGRYSMPQTIIDSPINRRGVLKNTRTILYGASTKETNVQFLKMLNNQTIYRLY